MKQKSVYTFLIFTGSIPFLVAAAAPYFKLYELALIGNIEKAIAFYSLAIVSFMAGTQWGMSLSSQLENQPSNESAMCRNKLMIISNLMVLLPWLIICILGSGVSYYFSLTLTFILIVLTDYRLASRNIITLDYCRTRLMATIAVSACLVSLAFTA